mmetsp:Transcript_48726/g.78516  ORF Transcript_48726/g.78516 Transcript_48726/m.78516 type:complete len:446 (-) Transcript_48726:522-1859(-)
MAEKAANLAPLPLLIALVLLMPKLMLLKMGLLLPRKLAGLGVDGDVASEDTALSHHQTAPEDEQSQDSKSGPLPHSGGWWAGQKLDAVFNVEGSTLGQGQYGLVKKASYQHSAAKKWSYKDLAGGTEVAIKIINLPPKNLAKLRTKGRQAVLDKAEKEMEIHMELVHPNVVRLYGWFEEDNTYSLVMELMRGGDLFDWLAERELNENKELVSEEHAKHMFVQLLNGVEYLHTNSIVHRDLKPENIMIHSRKNRDWPDLKIADFGEAKKLIQSVTCKTMIGTPQTMAPEAFLLKNSRRTHQMDTRSVLASGNRTVSIDGKIADVWALGVILHVILVMCYPFDSAAETHATTTNQEPKENGVDTKSECVLNYRNYMLHLGLEANKDTSAEIVDPFASKVWELRSPKASSKVKEVIRGLLKPRVTERWTLAITRGHSWMPPRNYKVPA